MSGRTNATLGHYDFAMNSEVIDLHDAGVNCQSWPDHPIGTYGAAGHFIDDQLLVCGGENANGITKLCYSISPSNAEKQCNLTFASQYSSGTRIDDDTIWITGGLGIDNQTLDRTEYVHVSQTENSLGLNFPSAIYGHCFIRIADKTFFLSGGFDGVDTIENKTYILSLEEGGRWQFTPGLEMSMNRYFHACGSFTFNNELILAVVGGATYTSTTSNSNSSEFLSYDSEDSHWDNRGTELDLLSNYDLSGQLLVSNGETLFYINTLENVFFKLGHTLEGFEWIQMNLRLETPRQFAIGVLIRDELTDCKKRLNRSSCNHPPLKLAMALVLCQIGIFHQHPV